MQVRALVDRHPEVLEQVYGDGQYEGENLLHICIVQKKHALAERLLREPRSVPAQLAARATGSFFRPHELQVTPGLTQLRAPAALLPRQFAYSCFPFGPCAYCGSAYSCAGCSSAGWPRPRRR